MGCGASHPVISAVARPGATQDPGGRRLSTFADHAERFLQRHSQASHEWQKVQSTQELDNALARRGRRFPTSTAAMHYGRLSLRSMHTALEHGFAYVATR
jgi:hypothetical protein